MNSPILIKAIETLVDIALHEDCVSCDCTSKIAVKADSSSVVALKARQDAVIVGINIAKLIYQKLDPKVVCDFNFKDGDKVVKGDSIATISGPTATILSGERTVLNFMQRLSGIATVTQAYIKAVDAYKVDIVDTRKTTPGWRLLEKYAVKCGGGVNHRNDLSDMIMFKDNHIGLSGKTLAELVVDAKISYPKIPIACEADNLEQFYQLIKLDLDIIMLDNMSLADMTTAVKANQTQIKIEATGGVNLETVAAIAATGVDRISIGALTHSVKAVDLAFDTIEN